jgi:hypothetical protein
VQVAVHSPRENAMRRPKAVGLIIGDAFAAILNIPRAVFADLSVLADS